MVLKFISICIKVVVNWTVFFRGSSILNLIRDFLKTFWRCFRFELSKTIVSHCPWALSSSNKGVEEAFGVVFTLRRPTGGKRWWSIQMKFGSSN